MESSSQPAAGAANVTLTLSSGEKIRNPDHAQLQEALGKLDVARDGEGFAILMRTEMTYMQVSGDKKMGFDMEYQEGDVKHHYRAERTDFSLDDVVRAMEQYRDGTIDWPQYGSWHRITW